MKINNKFIISLQGKSYVTYEGLLDLAHQMGLQSIEVELIQIPSKENNITAICKATARTENQAYTDLGDASPQSVNSNIVPHLIRMASTRAKARVLRDLTNVGMTAFEEISYNENVSESDNGNESSVSESPTKRQIETIQKLSKELDTDVNYKELSKRSAGNLISDMLEEIKNRRD